MSAAQARMLPPNLVSKGKGKGKKRPGNNNPPVANGGGGGRPPQKETLLPPDDGKPHDRSRMNKKDGDAAANKPQKRRRPNAEDSDEEKEVEGRKDFNPFGTSKKEQAEFEDYDSNALDYEQIRQSRLNARKTGGTVKDTVGEGEGIREENPTLDREQELGYRLEAFNMDREMEEGRFDEGEGVFQFDEVRQLKEVTDMWLDEVDKGTKEAKMTDKDIRLIREREAEEAEKNRVNYNPERLKRELADLLAASETPGDAMRRLNREAGIREASTTTGGSSSSSTAGSSSKFLLPHERKKRKLEKQQQGVAGTNGNSTADGKNGSGSKVETNKSKRVFDPVWGTWTTSSGASSGVAGQPQLAAGEVFAPGYKKRVVDVKLKGAEDASRIGELCNILLELGAFDIYDIPKEKIVPPEVRKAQTAQMNDMMKDLLDDSDDEEEGGASKNGAVPGNKSSPPAAPAVPGAGGAGPASATSSSGASTTSSRKWQYQLNGQTYGPFEGAMMKIWEPMLKGKGLKVRVVDAQGRPTDAHAPWGNYDETDFT
ncbi:unnamed protein product [Amoebophrya sp. A120]|nr:unnamed protein product [Amoebophrya sp. A120]|eukprot:GSA120T00025434001.1